MRLKKFDVKNIDVGTTRPKKRGPDYRVRGPGSKSVDTTPSRIPLPDDPDFYDGDGKPDKGRKRARSPYEWFDKGFRALERGK